MFLFTIITYFIDYNLFLFIIITFFFEYIKPVLQITLCLYYDAKWRPPHISLKLHFCAEDAIWRL